MGSCVQIALFVAPLLVLVAPAMGQAQFQLVFSQAEMWMLFGTVLLVAHVAEVITWSLAYAILDVVPPGADALYFAFVNYTTLGYGDIVPVERWRLLGPMAAMNGVLLFGWSTAIIFEAMRQAMHLSDQRGEA